MNNLTTTEFFDKEYSQYAVYDTQRKIAHLVDGLKISQRKILHTQMKTLGGKQMKVDAIANFTAGATEYLHGAGNLEGVIVNMVVDYVGGNNYPLLEGSGHFGSRSLPRPSASRYIYASVHENTNKLFSKVDEPVLEKQHFEGSEIEPKFLLPVLPNIFLNGAQGLAVGFSQTILPRKIENIKEAIKLTVAGKPVPYELMLPHYNGFRGEIVHLGENTYEIHGVYERYDSTTILVKELPVGYDLNSYVNKLEKLLEKKVIKDYKDKSEDDDFLFEIKVDRRFTKRQPKSIKKDLGLITHVSEVLNLLDVDGKVSHFESPQEILKRWVEIKIQYMRKRIDHQIESLANEIDHKTAVNDLLRFIQENIEEFIDSDEEKFQEKCKKSLANFTDSAYNSVNSMRISSIKKVNVDAFSQELEKMQERLSGLKSSDETKVFLQEMRGIK